MMFAAFCPTHDARILMTRRNVLDFWNGPDGPVIHWRCGCGHEGFLDTNGSHATPASHGGAPDGRDTILTSRAGPT